MFRTLLIVALGGGVGSALRYAVSKFVQDNMSGAFPYHTFAVNIAGCLLDMKNERIDLHKYLGDVKSGSNEFLLQYNAFEEKYKLEA